MAITFAPKRGAILICDFDMARINPEFDKARQVVVFSVDSLNHKHGTAAGTCTVIPFSSRAPSTGRASDVFFELGSYWSLTMDCWARCGSIMTISHRRLDLVLRNGHRERSEFLKEPDMLRIEEGVKAALNLH